MRKLSLYVFLLAVMGFSAYSIYDSLRPACSGPIKYDIGRFDTQFGITEDTFKSYVAEAETVWENVLARDEFVYEKGAPFKINLIYDERQILTFQKRKTEFGLTAMEETFVKLDSDFNAFKSAYNNKASAYESALARFSARKSAYDREVAFWNDKGGAPEGKYAALESERRYLNAEAERLNAEAQQINAEAKQLNSLLSARNAKASEYNKMVAEYNKSFNGGLEFNQAEYTGQGINVYQFGNKKDLTLALTHEFGHSLGMEHVENPKSIMYYITGPNTETSLAPSAEDFAELQRVCE